MKKIILFLAIPAIFLACKGNENKSDATATDSTSTAAPVDTAKATSAIQYTCPMHPDVISDKPGTCPQCGMELQVKS
ncbi:MAG TPA: heavy metal-binding domain-containing protein [Bacteroidia bacterium]|nr:heavy metal-binding domain-containing protein [Bacteroidia bacterium]HNP98253.1 heavy metal-binding domain-containing protein [Bacteroidia bacterium]